MKPGKTEPPRIIGPQGSALTPANLPLQTQRWVRRRKTEVVIAGGSGLLSLDDACARYELTVEEFLSWQRAVESDPRALI